VKLHIERLMMVFMSFVLSSAAQVNGSGSAGFVPRWTGGTTLGNSNIADAGGKVAVAGPNGTTGVNGGNAPTAFQVTAGSGVTNLSGFGVQGAGGPIQAVGGNGGSLPGSLASGGTGAMILITGGSGADCVPASVRCGAYDGGNGGSVILQPGAGGRGTTSSGHAGNVLLAATGGNVGIGEMSPRNTLEIKVGGTTLADAWSTRSSRQFKTNIEPLQGALKKIEQLQGVSYDRKNDGRHEIGLVAEEVDRIVPEVVSHNPETSEAQGVDYSRLTALLIEALKTQQAEILQLKRQIEQLTVNARGSRGSH
jgi:hypothetical protein